MQNILLIGVVAECVLLLLLAAIKKCTRKTFLVITAVTALCCGIVAVAGSGSIRRTPKNETSTKGYVYMAARLLEQGKPHDALQAMGQVTETEGEQYGARGLRALAYNHNGAFSAGAYLLKGTEDTDLTVLYDSCVSGEPLNEELSQKIISKSVDLVSLSEKEMARYDAEMAIRYGSQPGEVTEDSALILRIKAAVENSETEKAYELALENAADGSVADSILVSEMYIRNFNQQELAQADEAFDLLLKDLTDAQIQLNRIAAESSAEEKEYRNAEARYSLALKELNEESAKRACNYLSYDYTEGTAYDLAYDLQMSGLMLAAGDKEQAVSYLDKIFLQKELNPDQWLAVDIMLLKEAYLNGMDSMVNQAYDFQYHQLMNTLYQGVFENDEAVDYDFYDFLHSYLEDIFGGIYIGRPDVRNFPQVSVSVSTSPDIELTTQSVVLTDTEKTVETFEVTENQNSDLSICFVLDISGSMEGRYLTSAKQAIKGFASNIDAGIPTALVSFENYAHVDCPLVDSAYVVAARLEKLHAYGGTNISAGLLTGAQQLSGVDGQKIIILLSDGIDLYPDQLPEALQQLRMDGVVVHAIGLPGCDEHYLSNIAYETGGTYFPAADEKDLSKIYSEIRNFIGNSYTVTYEVTNEEQIDRTIEIEAVDSMAHFCRKYTTVQTDDQYSYIYDKQASGLFKQIGGTLGGN